MPKEHIRVYNRTFCGVKAQHSALTYEKVDKILKDSKAERIVELGTADGALSMYLGLVGARLGIPVYTIDRYAVKTKETKEVFDKLGVYQMVLDIMSEEGKSAVRSLIADVPVYLICDNGNKKEEFNSFAGNLANGSVVSVHDWGMELTKTDIVGTIESMKLAPFMEEEWLLSDLMFATWCVQNNPRPPVNQLMESTQWKRGSTDTWHRESVGGKFSEMGRSQLNMLIQNGLTSGSKLLDIGCGSLRLGMKAIEYLNPGNYYGIECDNAMLQAGIDRELNVVDSLKGKNPSFSVNEVFDTSSFGDVCFDFATAHSVFTHLPPPAIEMCLGKTFKRLRSGGKFFATYNMSSTGFDYFGHKYPEMTRYNFQMFSTMARKLNVDVCNIGDWGIPQNKSSDQLLMIFTKRS
jgi:hypothetical protein